MRFDNLEMRTYVTKQALIVGGSALWAPALWILLISTNDVHDWTESFTSYGRYGIYWPLMTWLGAVALSASTWLLVRRFGPGVLIACVPWIILVVVAYLFLIALSMPDDSSCDGWCFSIRRREMKGIAFAVGGALAGSSAPLWAWLVMGELVGFLIRKYR